MSIRCSLPVFITSGFLVLGLLPNEAIACRQFPGYHKLSLEQKVSRQPLIFIGRVTLVDGDKVTIQVEETLRGAHLKTRELRQTNSMCLYRFTAGQRLFYAGSSFFGPTRNLHGDIPADLAPIVEKLRKQVPLDIAPDYVFESAP